VRRTQSPRSTASRRRPPNSVLSARLTTLLDSARSVRGTPVSASVTVPVFSADHRLLLPEGTALTGEVTQARPARHFRRNGQLRFLILSVGTTVESAADLARLAARRRCHFVPISRDRQRGGGASMTNSKTRFVAPALRRSLSCRVGQSAHRRGRTRLGMRLVMSRRCRTIPERKTTAD